MTFSEFVLGPGGAGLAAAMAIGMLVSWRSGTDDVTGMRRVTAGAAFGLGGFVVVAMLTQIVLAWTRFDGAVGPVVFALLAGACGVMLLESGHRMLRQSASEAGCGPALAIAVLFVAVLPRVQGPAIAVALLAAGMVVLSMAARERRAWAVAR